ncbi:hypothetical protein [Kitasatospora sp. NPDC050463]|uniref:hypothetical protein n=1 Tax=Kitasatospora sp. NPDC050463 TaxID=3155786 RepID=UPI00340149AC
MDNHFDLVVIGSGSGNSIVDKRFADWRVAFVEKGVGPPGSFGGTCLNVGCIPTKASPTPTSSPSTTSAPPNTAADPCPTSSWS